MQRDYWERGVYTPELKLCFLITKFPGKHLFPLSLPRGNQSSCTYERAVEQ